MIALAALLGCATGGGPVEGPRDTGCSPPTAIDPDACDGPDGEVAEGEVHYGTEAGDDACKYRVEYKYSRATRRGRTSFELAVTALDDGSPATDADPRLVAELDGRGPEDAGTPVESGFGRYLVNDVRFGRPGRWTLRFELYPDCAEGASSPRASVAFWYDVP